jgi:hypothetical protein
MDEFVKVRRRNLQNVPDIRAAGISRPDRVFPFRKHYLRLRQCVKFQDDLGLRVESMHVTRSMVFQIGDKSHSIEPNRSHNSRIRRFWSLRIRIL